MNNDKYYENCKALKELIREKKYLLDCGHLVTMNHNLANNVVIINEGKEVRIICTGCYE